MRRHDAFIVAVNCGEPGGTCFCVSMRTGPKASSGFDLALTELLDGDGHRFLVEVGSHAGAEAVVARAAGRMGRSLRIDLNSTGLPANIVFTSSHALGFAAAVEIARTLQLAPAEIIVYAVEGPSFDHGAPLTPAVATAARDVADRVVAEIGRLRQGSRSAP